MTLVDTCVWIDHARRTDPVLMDLLRTAEAVLHPFVFGELISGTLGNRGATIQILERLPSVPVVRDVEVRHLVESQRLWGLGLGWVDLHLLASTMIARANLLTDDRRLAAAARRLGIGYPIQ